MNKPKQLTFPWNKVNKSSLEGFYTSQENSHIISLLKDIQLSMKYLVLFIQLNIKIKEGSPKKIKHILS